MRLTVLSLALLGGGVYYQTRYLPVSEAKAAAERFLRLYLTSELERARPLATGPALAELESAINPIPASPRGSSGRGVYNGLLQQVMSPESQNSYLRQMSKAFAGNIRSISYSYESSDILGSGAVRLRVVAQIVSRGNTVATTFETESVKYIVEVRRFSSGWLVYSFAK